MQIKYRICRLRNVLNATVVNRNNKRSEKVHVGAAKLVNFGLMKFHV